MATMQQIDIGKLLPWGDPFEVQTKLGSRMLRKAKPTGEFWDVWRVAKDELKKAGLSCSKSVYSGDWEVCWWLPIDKEEAERRQKAVEESQAASADIVLPVPDGLDYLPYQKAGIRYALNRKGVLLADEMGLGKTIQAIGVINADDSIKKVLVVCPASLKINWKRELNKWLVRPLTVGIAGKSFPSFCDVVIINYDILGKYEAWLNEVYDLVILDEAHLIKNPRAKRTVAALAIKAKRRAHLTGTPICNRPAELYTIIKDLHPKWADQKSFGRRYAKNTSEQRMKELNRILRETCMVRRLKADVLTELPPKVRSIVEIDTADDPSLRDQVSKERAAYEEYLRAKEEAELAVEMAKISESEEEYKEAVSQLKAVSVAFESISAVRHETALAKVPAALNIVREQIMGDEPKKLVIFAHHKDVVDAIMAGARESGWNPVKVTGEDSMDARQKAVDRFQVDPSCYVFVGNIKAAGVGLTLTASSDVVFFELDWVPGNVTQAEDRCHRIGQKDTVFVKHIVLSDSLDANMAKTLVEKQAIIDSALDSKDFESEEIEEQKSSIIAVPATASLTREHVKAYELGMTDEYIQLAQSALNVIVAYDPDRAQEENNIGFNKYDGEIGRRLAAGQFLTGKQAVFALKLANKYRRQLSGDMREAVMAAWKHVASFKPKES